MKSDQKIKTDKLKVAFLVKAIIFSCFLFVIFGYSVKFAKAANIVWSGAGGNQLWSNNANWVGGVAPGSNDTAVFDNTCGATCNSTMDTSAVNTLQMASTYTATTTVASGNSPNLVTINLDGGTFVAGNTPWIVTSAFNIEAMTQTGGVFVNDTAGISIRVMTLTGGIFNANNAPVSFSTITQTGGTFNSAGTELLSVNESISLDGGTFIPPTTWIVTSSLSLNGTTVTGSGTTLDFLDSTTNNSGESVSCTGTLNSLTGIANVNIEASTTQTEFFLDSGCSLTAAVNGSMAFLEVDASSTLTATGGTWVSWGLNDYGLVNFNGSSFLLQEDITQGQVTKLVINDTGTVNIPNATSFIDKGDLIIATSSSLVYGGTNFEVDRIYENNAGPSGFNISGKNLLLGGDQFTDLICYGNFNATTGVSSVVINKTYNTFSKYQSEIEFDAPHRDCVLTVQSVNADWDDNEVMYITKGVALNVPGDLNIGGGTSRAGGGFLQLDPTTALNFTGSSWTTGEVDNGGTINATSSGPINIFGPYDGDIFDGSANPPFVGGTFNTPAQTNIINDNDSDSGNVILNDSYGDTINLGSGTLNVQGEFQGMSDFNAGTGTVILDGTNQLINDSNTFYNLTKIATSTDTLIFNDQATQTILSTLTLQGTSGNDLSLVSDSSPNQWAIDAQGSRSLCYLDIQDSFGINSTPLKGFQLTDLGNNHGWDFVSNPSCSGGGGGGPTTTDVSLSKTVDHATSSVGSLLTYTLVATNNGAITATSVSVTDVLPSGLTLQSSTSTLGSFSGSTWTVGNLGNGSTATLTLVTLIGSPAAGNTLINTATATGTTPDLNLSNNTSSATTTVASLGGGGGCTSNCGGGGGVVILPTPTPTPIATATSTPTSTPITETLPYYGLTINDGAATTTSSTVTLQLFGGIDPITMKVSNTPDLSGQETRPFASNIGWDLCDDPSNCSFGSHTVYAEFYDVEGNASPEVSNQIVLLGSAAPVIQPPQPPATPVSSPSPPTTTITPPAVITIPPSGSTPPQPTFAPAPTGIIIPPVLDTNPSPTPTPAPTILNFLSMAAFGGAGTASCIGLLFLLCSQSLYWTGGRNFSLPAYVSSLSSLSDLKAGMFRSWLDLLGFLSLRKQTVYWGTVYDSRSKQPLDPVIVTLFDAATGEKITESISDLAGRFGFLVRPGSFIITAQKTHYQFPSKQLADKSEDGVFDHLYHGEVITIHSQSEVVSPNIPMDPLAYDWNQQDKKRIIKIHPRWEYFVQLCSSLLFWLGLILAVIGVLLSSDFWNYLILALYAIVAIVKWLIPSMRLWGRIFSGRTGEALGGLLLQLSPIEIPTVNLAKAVSGIDGKFFLKAGPGNYLLKITDNNQHLLTTRQVIVDKGGLVNMDVVV